MNRTTSIQSTACNHVVEGRSLSCLDQSDPVGHKCRSSPARPGFAVLGRRGSSDRACTVSASPCAAFAAALESSRAGGVCAVRKSLRLLLCCFAACLVFLDLSRQLPAPLDQRCLLLHRLLRLPVAAELSSRAAPAMREIRSIMCAPRNPAPGDSPPSPRWLLDCARLPHVLSATVSASTADLRRLAPGLR